MKQAVFLLAVVIVAVGMTNYLAEAKNAFWSIINQGKLEERPYTTPENIADPSLPLVMSRVNKLLHPSLREMHRFCDGQCFYAPESCDHAQYGCSLLLSVASHPLDEDGEMHCDYFGDDDLREVFCYNSRTQQDYRSETGKPDTFYTITLHRNLGSKFPGGEVSSSCPKRWKEKAGIRCRRSEFVAVSFVKSGIPETGVDGLDPADLWYVCTVDESYRSRVTMWTEVDPSNVTLIPQQLKETKPHVEAGMGVVFSKVDIDEDIASMGCQFIIQESNMTLSDDAPTNAAFFGEDSHHPIRVKLAEGYVLRDDQTGEFIRPFYSASEEFAHFKVYHTSDIKPRDDIEFNKLQVNLVEPSLNTPEMDNSTEVTSNEKMQDLVKKCHHPDKYHEFFIACYPPNHQQNCIHTGRCPVMFVVEVPKNDTSFEKVQAHIYGVIPESKSLRKARRPIGWAAVGFSKDDAMGRDVVIVCHADGKDNVHVHVSLNFIKTNIYPGNVSYDDVIISNRSVKTYASAEKSKILCSFQMRTKFVVNLFDYEPDYRDCISPGMSEKLSFDFSKEDVHLLIAAGDRNYPGGRVNFHDFAQVLNVLFSKELFLKKATGSCVTGSIMLITFSLLLTIWST